MSSPVLGNIEKLGLEYFIVKDNKKTWTDLEKFQRIRSQNFAKFNIHKSIFSGIFSVLNNSNFPVVFLPSTDKSHE